MLFRQRFGNLTPALGSMVTVGVANGADRLRLLLAHQTTGTPAGRRRSPRSRAGSRPPRTSAAPVARAGQVGDIVTSRAPTAGPGSRSPASPSEQQARLRALALADGTVRPVIEANVVDVDGRLRARRTRSMVDAVSGKVLHRQNQVDNEDDVDAVQGRDHARPPAARSTRSTLTDNTTKQIVAPQRRRSRSTTIVVKIFDPQGNAARLRRPRHQPGGRDVPARRRIPAGTYSVQVCPFDAPTVPCQRRPTTPAVGDLTSDRRRGARQPDAATRSGATSRPTRRLTSLGSATTPTNPAIGCWIPARGLHAAAPARCTTSRRPVRGTRSPRPARRR